MKERAPDQMWKSVFAIAQRIRTATNDEEYNDVMMALALVSAGSCKAVTDSLTESVREADAFNALVKESLHQFWDREAPVCVAGSS